MAKWVSPVFTDIRGQVGKAVTFSSWKGRGYFRSYVKPANPRTPAQLAHREVMKNLVKRWQSLAADPDVKAAWNERALEFLISGYNCFIKFGRSSWIQVSPSSFPAGTTYPQDVTITYKCGIPLSEARIYVFDGTTWTDITPAEGLQEQGSFVYSIGAAGTYYFFIATNKVLKTGDTSPQPYQAVTKWYPDEANGVAVEAVCNAQ